MAAATEDYWQSVRRVLTIILAALLLYGTGTLAAIGATEVFL